MASLQFPVCSHHDNRSLPLREEIVPKTSRFASSLDRFCQREETFGLRRGLIAVCHAMKQQRDVSDGFGGNPSISHSERLNALQRKTGNGIAFVCNDCEPFRSVKDATKRNVLVHYRNRKKAWLDPFQWGDVPGFFAGAEFAEEGLQDPDFPNFPVDPDNPYGFLDFPAGYNVELSSLPVLARGDVRRCCCIVAGGVYENLLFFPVIQMLKERYPGVLIDIVASARGKQTYELNKNVRLAWVYDVYGKADASERMEFIGKIKNEDYELLVSTKLTGFGHAATLWMTSARDKIAYVYPDVNAAGAGIFLTDWAEAPRLNLSEGGYHMYADIIEVLKNPQSMVPEMSVKPLQIGVSKRLRTFMQEKYMVEEIPKGDFLVFHGIESTSKASMQSLGDSDSLLPLKIWAELAHAASILCVIVVPMVDDAAAVVKEVGKEAGKEWKMLLVTTPGQLAGLINDSVGVVTTNTAAVQLACALKKPSVALFSSAEKASLFVPHAKESNCTVVASETGKLVNVDVETAISAMKEIEKKTAVYST